MMTETESIVLVMDKLKEILESFIAEEKWETLNVLLITEVIDNDLLGISLKKEHYDIMRETLLPYKERLSYFDSFTAYFNENLT